jgi:hypothetical protein
VNTSLLIIFLLFTKHFIIDFPLQKPYQWMNKGTYGHPGGLLHSGLHGFGTFFVLFFFTPMAWALALLDFVVHYHVDWAKMRLNAKMGWGANTHEEFWWLLGLDQYLHALTYIAIVGLL